MGELHLLGDERPLGVTSEHLDVHKLAGEIEAEVRARRAAGEYPPGFERELDELFARFAPPEVSSDFESALEHAEDLVVVDPTIPVASRNPVFGTIKRVLARMIGWYHAWVSQQVTALATALTTAIRLLGSRVVDLERDTGHLARARAVGARAPAVRDDALWSGAVVEALRGRTGRVAVVECGGGELVAALVAAGIDAYGVEPRAEPADAARSRGLEIRVDDGVAHLHSVDLGALDALVLRGLVERLPVGELALLVDTAVARVREGGVVVVCSLAHAAWGAGPTAAEADLVAGRPLHPDAWEVLLAGTELDDVRVSLFGDRAFAVLATRVTT